MGEQQAQRGAFAGLQRGQFRRCKRCEPLHVGGDVHGNLPTFLQTVVGEFHLYRSAGIEQQCGVERRRIENQVGTGGAAEIGERQFYTDTLAALCLHAERLILLRSHGHGGVDGIVHIHIAVGIDGRRNGAERQCATEGQRGVLQGDTRNLLGRSVVDTDRTLDGIVLVAVETCISAHTVDGHVIDVDRRGLGGFGLSDGRGEDMHVAVSRTVYQHPGGEVARGINLRIGIAVLSAAVAVGRTEFHSYGLSVEFALHLTAHLHVFTGQIVGLVGSYLCHCEGSLDIEGQELAHGVVGRRELAHRMVGIHHGIEPAVAHQLRNGGRAVECGLATYLYIPVDGGGEERRGRGVSGQAAARAKVEVELHTLDDGSGTHILYGGREGMVHTRIEFAFRTTYHGDGGIGQGAVGHTERDGTLGDIVARGSEGHIAVIISRGVLLGTHGECGVRRARGDGHRCGIADSSARVGEFDHEVAAIGRDDAADGNGHSRTLSDSSST